ncbi:MAG: CARDB domain-containing protein [Chloroflexota bacterium]
MKKMLKVFSLVTVLTLLFGFFPAVMPVSAQSVTININAPTQVVAGGNFTATVDISNVSVNATDKAGNRSTSSATFTRKAITVDGISATTVTTSTASLEVETNGSVSGNISVTQHQGNPSGALTPEGASNPVGVFLEIVASTELVNNLKQIHILAEYNPDELPEGTDNETLKIYLWDAVSGMWEAITNSGPVVIDNRYYIEGYIDHLSKYGTFGAQTGGGTGPTASGGGGGVGGSTIIIILNGLATTANMEVDSNGVIFKTSQLQTIDQKVTLDITQGTKLMNNEGAVLKTLSASKVAAPPVASPGQVIVQSYQLGPDGARFEPAISLTMSYDPAALPQGTSEKELYIGYWESTKWTALPSIINSETDTVSANISHFTQFAVIAKFPLQPQPTAPPEQPPVTAEFKLTDLLINPAEVIAGSPVAVSIVLNNTGGSEGNYTVVLKINGTEEDKKNITLKAGEKEAVTFTVTKQKEGSYTVSIDDISGQFTITAAPPAVPEPKPGLHWPLIVSIAGGVIILGLILRFTVFRRRW